LTNPWACGQKAQLFLRSVIFHDAFFADTYRAWWKCKQAKGGVR
jgi:hypothetical protein